MRKSDMIFFCFVICLFGVGLGSLLSYQVGTMLYECL